MCDKSVYLTYDAAISHLRTLKRKCIGKAKIPKRAYKCPDCGLYHLTSLKHVDHKRKRKFKRLRFKYIKLTV